MFVALHGLLSAASAPSSPSAPRSSRVLVLGPHHSGTSLVAWALGELGLHLGEPSELLMQQSSEANPFKYHERRDVVRLNMQRLLAGGAQDVPGELPAWVGYGFRRDSVATHFDILAAAAIVAKLDRRGGWAIKDPRFSLTAADWLPLLGHDAACILTVRHPLDFASTMLRYSRTLALWHWGAIWEHYMGESARACAAQPLVLVRHDALVRQPERTVYALHARLGRLGVRVRPPNATALAAAMARLDAPPPPPRWRPEEFEQMPPAALRLYHGLVTRALAEEAIDESANDDDDAAAVGTATSAVPPIEVPPTAWPPLPSGVDAPGGVTGETYATLLTTADRRYLAGAVALGSSIRAVEVSGRPLIALVTAAVPESWTPLLESVGWRVVRIEALPEPWWGTYPRCVRYAADENARWGHMFTKLRLFALSNSSSIFYLDADALLLRDPTSLFRSPAAFAAEAAAGAHAATFNAGVMRLRPSEATFAALLALSRGTPPSIYRSVVDCTEQALLNLHYDGSNPELTPARFPVARPAAVAAVADAAPVAAHFITTRCPKPWDVPRALAEAAAAAEEAAVAVAEAAEAEEDAAKGVGDPSLAEPSLARTLPAGCSASLYVLWWRVYARTGIAALAGGAEDVKGAEGAEGDVAEGDAAALAAARHVRRELGEYEGCSLGCPNSWVGDDVCDEACNNPECEHDANDCFWNAGECYSEADGSDYRGRVSSTQSGRQCQAWSAQVPNHHTFSTNEHPSAGLGGHNFCRNPDRSPEGPWCFTMDFPNMRREACQVGAPAPACDASHNAVAPGAPAAVKTADASLITSTALTLGSFADGRVREDETRAYELAVPPALAGLKIVLVPITGDSDLLLSFSQRAPTRQQATWIIDSIGVKQFTLPRTSPYFCAAAARDTGLPMPLADPTSCHLYIGVSGYEEGDFKLAVYPYDAAADPEAAAAGGGPAAGGGHAAPTEAPLAYSCSPGCDERGLGNHVCDVSCNTSACFWDSGDCGYLGAVLGAVLGGAREPICNTGCPVSWRDDGECDEACFNAACSWDADDCTPAREGCSDGCVPSWLEDDECDELCHNEACGWDGADCDHGEDGCHVLRNGSDYRGSVAVSVSGRTCQMWSHQTPHAHTHTHAAFPNAGLGGHNACRNPGGAREGVWCYTMDPSVPWELCHVPPATSAGGCEVRASANPHRFHTLCPLDCKALLGNDICELRCNISSCSYDMGDCGVGFDLTAAVLADQGLEAISHSTLYVLVVLSVLAGLGVGLIILRLALHRIKRDEEKRRGYTASEMKGIDQYDEDEA